jgi:YVTN family beta-propeller protein
VLKYLPPGFRQVDVTPVDLIMTRDGRKAFVTLGRANHIAVVDVTSRKTEAYVLVGSRPWGLKLSRDEKRLYVANGLSDDMAVIDVPTMKVLKTVPVGRVPWGVLVDD